MPQEYRICSRCIMDTTDATIQFDAKGVCNHCQKYDEVLNTYPFNDETARRQELERVVERIKTRGAGKPYDCIIGVSGGVDSTYLAYIVKKQGLRPLAVHLDNGWDSELAVHNIEKALNNLGIDLYTHVLDWQEFKDLQISFLKASVSDAEIPTDHAIGGILYRMAAKYGVKYIILGTNQASESGIPLSWTYGVGDWRYISGIQSRFGSRRLVTYSHFSFLDEIRYKVINGIRVFPILDYVPYFKEEALKVLQEELGWQYYGGKHYESIYTRFFQGYILPHKFTIDKRRAHFSSLIRSRQMTRESALKEIMASTYDRELQSEDREYVVKKLELTEKEFEDMMAAPVKTYEDYPTYYSLARGTVGFEFARRLRRALGRI